MTRLFTKIIGSPSSWLTLVLLLVNLPHFERYQSWSIISIILLSGLQLYRIANSQFRLSRIIIILLTLTLVIFTYRQYQTITGIEAGTNLLSLMLFCKLLESNSRRDHTILIFLSFFVVSTNFLFSQSMATAVYMVFCITFILITLITMNQDQADIAFKDKIKIALRMMAYAVPVMLILFVFFPRISGSLWKTNTTQSESQTGFSDHMEPGNISDLIESNALAFRVSFDSQVPLHRERYWRAITLWQFDGRRWDKAKFAEQQSRISIGQQTYDYTVTAEPSKQKWLFLLDLPYSVSDKLNLDADFTTSAPELLTNIYQYRASSAPDYRFNSPLSYSARQQALQLPGTNVQSIKLAQEWKQQLQSPEKIIDRALHYFRDNNFSYSLKPPLLVSYNTVDQFLFQTRKGFCEHYASAFAVLMRAAGIPARVIIGYQGGEINSLNNVMSVDQSMAHAWNEVWIEGNGWTRIDPTSIIAPERISENLKSAIRDRAELPFHLRFNSEYLQKIRQYFDLIDNQWNQWVISYNSKNQKRLLEYLAGEKLSLKDISYLFIQILLATLAVTALFYFWRQGRNKTDATDMTYLIFCELMKKYGYGKQKHEGPAAYSARLQQTIPALKTQIEKILDLYILIRYRSENSAENIEQFRKMVERFKSQSSNRKLLRTLSVKN